MRDSRTVEELYAEHWRYVLTLLCGCGIPPHDAEDVAQSVWMNVHRRHGSYDPGAHKTPRAWITGFVVRCAANHRRTQRRRALVPMEEPQDVLAAVGLDPEQAAILADLHRVIPNEDQRVALLLQVRHGLTVAEIAAVQEVTESAVEWRLQMARKHAKNDDDDKRAGAFLGFGSLEALAKALQPAPIPEEVGRRQWEKIAERIRNEGGAPDGTEPSPPSFPPTAVPAAPASPAVPALITLGTAKLTAILLLAFMSGSGSGVGCVAVWRAPATTRYDSAPRVIEAEPMSSARAAPSSTPAARTPRPDIDRSATLAGPAVFTSTTLAMGVSSAPAAPSEAVTLDEDESRRLLARMRDAMISRHFSTVLALADHHARHFGTTHRREREALRIEALRQTGRTKHAKEQASALIAAHPEQRNAMERAAGQALP